MQYPRYCTGCNSFNISHGLNLMLRKLTRHISTLAIRVVQFLSYLFFSHFSSSAFPNLNFKKLKKIISLGDCKSMAESPWASALPTPPPPLPPPVMLPCLVFSFFKVFLQLSLSSHCIHTTAIGVHIIGVTTTGGYRVSLLSLSNLFFFLFQF